ncbi:SDR family oxidoreductase [Spirosoma arcticum]
MRIVFITGCANGIGRHLATVFYQRGDAVVVTDVDEAGIRTLTATWDPNRVLVARLDVRDRANWQQLIDQTLARWGRIDVGLNVAGVLRVGYVSEFDPADIDFIFDINVKGVLLGSRLLTEQMVKQESGHLINIASLAALSPVLGMSLYSSSKFAVRAFTLAAAGELRSQGVRVSVVCPDLVATNMLTQQIDQPEAALSFTGSRTLTVGDVERAVLHDALERNRVEIIIPASRGWLSKLGNAFPGLLFRAAGDLTKKGRAKQKQYAADLTNHAHRVTD